jgi:hypothetical protein
MGKGETGLSPFTLYPLPHFPFTHYLFSEEVRFGLETSATARHFFVPDSKGVSRTVSD